MDSDRLLAICAGLGLPAEDETSGAITGYAKGEYCLDSLRDLQRFLRRDDPYKRDVFKQICKWKTVSRDLIPIIEFHQTERNLVINSVKILVFLTMPVDPESHDIAQQLEYLWELKSSLARSKTIAIIVSLLEDPLDHLESDTFTEEDWKLVQLILTLFRNLLSIRQITLHQKACGSATKYLQLADHFIEIMFQENVMDIILVLTQHLEENTGFIKHDNLLFLEIFHYVFDGKDPEMVAKSGINGSNKDGEISSTVDSLKSIMEKEAKKRKEIGQRNLERHSQFSGTFTRFLVDGSKTLYKRQPNLGGPDESLLKVQKVKRGPQKRIAWDRQLSAPPKEDLLEALRGFAEQFLSGGYNVLMQSIRNDIRKEHPSIQNSDIITFFQVAQFVLSFHYHSVSKKNVVKRDNLNICGPVAETVNEEMFKLVINRWQEIFEGIKQTNDYKSLSAAGSLLKHMIFMIDLVLKLEKEESREAHTSRVLLYKLFYDQTEQGLTYFVLNLFKSFDMHKQPKSDLADLLEIIHVIFRLMESLQQRGTLRVAKKARRIKKKKIPKIPPQETDPNPLEPSRSSEAPTVSPTDPSRSPKNQLNPSLSPTEPSEDQPDPAVGPTEPSRNSENQPDPAVNPTEPSENQPDPAVGPTEPSRSSESQLPNQPDPAVGPTDPPLGAEQEAALSSSEEEDETPITNEVDFNVERLVMDFVTNTTVHNVCWLLKHYKTNSVRTNHYVVCMLRRICEDLGMTAMLYQLSLLTTFYEILSEQKHSKSKEYSTIVNFLSKLVRDMMKLFTKQPLLFVKILFWKTRRECHHISADALISDAKNMRNDLNDNNDNGNNNGENSGFGHSQFFNYNKSIADSLGDDEADLVPNYEEMMREGNHSDEINENEGGKSEKKTNKRRRLKKSLSNQEEDNNDKSDSIPILDLPKVPKKRRNSIFSPLQENLIKDLFEKHKEDKECCKIIAEALDPNGNISPVQISRKLKHLGLRNVTKRKKSTEMESPDCDLSSDDDDDEPLQTLITRRKRGKEVMNEKSEINEGPDSDNETLGSILSQRKKSKKGKEVLNEKSQVNEINEELDSDDEPLSSIFSQRKKVADVSVEKSQINEINEGLDSDNEPLGSILRNKSQSQVQIKSPVKKFSVEPMNLEKDIEEQNLTDLKESVGKESNGTDFLDDEIDSDDEKRNHELKLLEDSDEETGSAARRKSGGSKRIFKMVLDFDDGDDDF
ncbi:hypothetical protein LUZ60_000564 [Juncus effusus]|nr:hypothetical protein LUZ60_000564 [Juncus effusus]